MATTDRTHTPAREEGDKLRGERAHALALSLAQYYASNVSDLATALGTTRDTVRAWLTDPPAKPREELLARAERLWVLARAAQRYIPDERTVGRWTLAPNLGLGGSSPAAVLVASGDDGLDRVLADMVSYAPARPDLPIEAEDELIWQGVQALLQRETLVEVEKVLSQPALDVTDADLAELDAFD